MKLQNKIEKIGIIVIAFICILVSILDFLGALESFSWISQRIPIMILLSIGMIALYLVTQNNRNFIKMEKDIELSKSNILSELNQKIEDGLVFHDICF